MCCFTRPVTHVGSTRIFARFLDREKQCIVYQMTFDAPEDLAMILPIPVVQPAKEDAVSFVDLSRYPSFFEDMAKAFPQPRMRHADGGIDGPFGGPGPELAVHRVGAFDASFVPTIADFVRLDGQFKLDDAVWKSLPQYKEYGFVVFKLRKGFHEVHPMAFRFPSALPGQIFFPTVHIHDGKVHETEEFDHTLYAQAWKSAVIKGPDWEESALNAGPFVKMRAVSDLVWAGGHLYKLDIRGESKNEDTVALARKMG